MRLVVLGCSEDHDVYLDLASLRRVVYRAMPDLGGKLPEQALARPDDV